MFKKTILALTLASSAFASVAAEVKDMNKTSYAIGVQSATLLNDNIKRSADLGVNINKDELIKGFIAGLSENADMTYDESLVFLQELDKVVQEKEKGILSEMAKENKSAGEEFMASQAKLMNVKTTMSGLQYKVIKEGTGAKPNASSEVTVHYKGFLIDGNEFDSSYKRGQPATFRLDGVIKGWTEGLQLMKVGGMYEFTIPSSLGYGDTGNPNVPPGATMVFVVELLAVK